MSSSHSKTTAANERAFGAVRINERSAKPRRVGITEIRGPYYTPVGPQYLEDILDTMGAYVDVFKFAGGSFALMPRGAVTNRRISDSDARMLWR